MSVTETVDLLSGDLLSSAHAQDFVGLLQSAAGLMARSEGLDHLILESGVRNLVRDGVTESARAKARRLTRRRDDAWALLKTLSDDKVGLTKEEIGFVGQVRSDASDVRQTLAHSQWWRGIVDGGDVRIRVGTASTEIAVHNVQDLDVLFVDLGGAQLIVGTRFMTGPPGTQRPPHLVADMILPSGTYPREIPMTWIP